MTVRRSGGGTGLSFRRISHMRNEGSRFLRDCFLSIHLCPHEPIASTTVRRSSPASVMRYSNTPVSDLTARRSMTPASSRSLSRRDNSVGDIFGRPRRRSLKRVDPAISSRNNGIVQRVHNTSDAIAIGQNCLYADCLIAARLYVTRYASTSTQLVAQRY